MISKEASVHLLLGLLFNQAIKSEAALMAPAQLLTRLGKETFDLASIDESGYDALYAAISAKPALHRFPSVMADYVFSCVCTVNTLYDADPRGIWQGRSNDEILTALMGLKGFGRHKAIQCLFYLYRLGETEQNPQEYDAYMRKNCTAFFDTMDVALETYRLL